MGVKIIQSGNFQKEFGKGIGIIDFYADWCGPCQMMKPVFEKLSNEIKEITFGKIDVDEEGELAGKFGVMSIPTLIFFKDGKEIERLVGFNSESMLKEKIKKILNR